MSNEVINVLRERDELRQKLLKLGATKAQAESKVVPMVVSVMLSNPDIISHLKWAEELQEERKRLDRYKKSLEIEIRDLRNKCQEYEEVLEAYKNIYSEIMADYKRESKELEAERQKQVEEFNKALFTGESEEGRDALRRAQLFIQSVNVDTKYDNTAYIVGLAAILSQQGMSPIEELKKINPRLFEVKSVKEPNRKGSRDVEVITLPAY